MTGTTESAVERHDRMVREERDQAERLRTDSGGDKDIWKSIANRFAVSTVDEPPVVTVLAGLAHADARVIDVGAGGGRLTLPLAKRVQEIVAVEPSSAMRDVLQAGIDRHGITNVTIVPSTWEDADVPPADLVFAAHVTYSVPRIEPFLRKLDSRATETAALVAFTNPALHVLAPFWLAVYGEERLRLPCRDELLAVLRELGAEPQVVPAHMQPVSSFGTANDAYEQLRRRLFVGAGTHYEARLRDAIERLAVEKDGELWPVEAHPNQQSVIWWRPGEIASA
jgi:2-polyprenyl-3-methyl-5-hydroxy-6-metoxy-1,4-benzoquinol methylase